MVGNTIPYQIGVDFLQIWYLFQNKHMFDAVDENEGNSDLHHIAEMIALLGPPSKDFLRRSQFISEYWDEEGQYLYNP